MWQWDFEASVVVGIGLWFSAYALASGPLRRRRAWGPPVPAWQQLTFHLGTVCALLALVSPLDTLGDTSLFSAHMAQHLLLTFVAPPLWLLGTPAWLIRRLAPGRWLGLLGQPMLAFAVFNGVMWAWHLPAAYDAALNELPLHILEHLSFMASAVIGWWPVLGPAGTGRLAGVRRLAYLIPALFSCTALAALITLSSVQLYPFYGQA